MLRWVIAFAIFSNSFASNKHVIGVHDGKNGLFSIFLGALGNIYWADKNGKTPVVHWKENNLYFQPDGHNGSDNPWEYYFEPVSDLQYEPADSVHKQYQAPDGFMVPYNGYGPQFYELRHALNQTIERYIKVRPEIMAKVNQFYETHMADTINIGVHLRGTDKRLEVKPVDPARICAIALNIGKKVGRCQYFVASDDQRLLDFARQQLERVVSYDATRSSDGWPVHYAKHGTKLVEPALLGEQVLIDMLLLAKCDYLVHTASNVATTVLLFNPFIENTFLSFLGKKHALAF